MPGAIPPQRLEPKAGRLQIVKRTNLVEEREPTLCGALECLEPRNALPQGIFGGAYFDTLRIEDVVKPECLLAYEMNDAPVSHVHGAPLRLRFENQLGFKMVKWSREIRFVETVGSIGEGYGGKNEDEEYFDLLPYI